MKLLSRLDKIEKRLGENCSSQEELDEFFAWVDKDFKTVIDSESADVHSWFAGVPRNVDHLIGHLVNMLLDKARDSFIFPSQCT